MGTFYALQNFLAELSWRASADPALSISASLLLDTSKVFLIAVCTVTELRRSPPRMNYLVVAFCLFFFANALAALYAPIQDCDEVFNYWEPTHYLNHGFGLQTWEYSPEYAIRSWLYIVIHAIPGKLGSMVFSMRSYEFYFVRMMLAAVCAGCETRLFSTISQIVNPRISMIFLLAMVTGPGMFHASVAYLPSSFTMYTSMMGVAAFMDWQGGLKTNQGIMWFGAGATVGWPFSAALIVPFLPDELIYGKLTGKISESVYRILDGIVRTLIVVVCMYPLLWIHLMLI